MDNVVQIWHVTQRQIVANVVFYYLNKFYIYLFSASSGFVCEDAATGCSQYINQCSDPNYTSLLAKNCRKTCNMCGPNCKDLSSK